MPYIPHTKTDINEMNDTLGIDSINDLFDEIPTELQLQKALDVLPALNEMQLNRLMQMRAKQDETALCFIGAGAYEHHIPAIVWQLASRGEFMTAYTPYQAEASQGLLQLIYEYQTMLAHLTGMEVSNASLYDGATALVEAILMAMRQQRRIKQHRILIPQSLHPHYRQVVDTLLAPYDVELITLPFVDGRIDRTQLPDGDITALVIEHPNFFGQLEEIDVLTDWAKEKKALVIAVVNPTSLALLKPPGQWGTDGADIVCGEGQPLGIPLASGGPYFGFFCTRKAFVRQMPGRVVGQTKDADGNVAYTLTLQTREQHIRRDKATSNICTNQGLAVTAATIYLSVMGSHGLQKIALACHENAQWLYNELVQLDGVDAVFSGVFYHEAVIRIKNAKALCSTLEAKKILPGLLLETYFPDMKDCILICATETKTMEDMEQLVAEIKAQIAETVAC